MRPKCHFLTRPSPHSKSTGGAHLSLFLKNKHGDPHFFNFMILILKIYCEKKNWQKSVHLFSSLTIVINRMHSISTLNSAYTNQPPLEFSKNKRIHRHFFSSWTVNYRIKSNSVRYHLHHGTHRAYLSSFIKVAGVYCQRPPGSIRQRCSAVTPTFYYVSVF